MTTVRNTIVTAAATVAMCVAVTAAHAALPNKCAYGKEKAAALRACTSKAVKKGRVVDPDCVAKYRSKFGDPTFGCFAKVEAKYGASCLTSGDVSAVETKVDDFIIDVASKLEPLCGNNS